MEITIQTSTKGGKAYRLQPQGDTQNAQIWFERISFAIPLPGSQAHTAAQAAIAAVAEDKPPEGLSKMDLLRWKRGANPCLGLCGWVCVSSAYLELCTK